MPMHSGVRGALNIPIKRAGGGGAWKQTDGRHPFRSRGPDHLEASTFVSRPERAGFAPPVGHADRDRFESTASAPSAGAAE